LEAEIKDREKKRNEGKSDAELEAEIKDREKKRKKQHQKRVQG